MEEEARAPARAETGTPPREAGDSKYLTPHILRRCQESRAQGQPGESEALGILSPKISTLARCALSFSSDIVLEKDHKERHSNGDRW